MECQIRTTDPGTAVATHYGMSKSKTALEAALEAFQIALSEASAEECRTLGVSDDVQSAIFVAGPIDPYTLVLDIAAVAGAAALDKDWEVVAGCERRAALVVLHAVVDGHPAAVNAASRALSIFNIEGPRYLVPLDGRADGP